METIQVLLINEGTTCWCSVEAVKIGACLYEISTDATMPEDEEWEFKPGTKVLCKIKEFQDGSSGMVAYAEG